MSVNINWDKAGQRLSQNRDLVHAWATVHPFAFAIMLSVMVGFFAHVL